MNLQPASKGPFVVKGYDVYDADGNGIVSFCGECTKEDDRANARYFAHAANVLPGCVEAMAAVEWSGHRSFCPDGSGADACPSCHGYKPGSLNEYDMQSKNDFDSDGFFGHAADCALKAALDAARGER